MSAKDKISTALQASQFTADQAEFLADELYSLVSHELAEKIRQEIKSLKDHEVLEPDKDWAASTAADFIDPEVEQWL